MAIDLKASYIAKVDTLGICPKGTKLRPWLVPNSKPLVQMTGAVNPEQLGWNLPNGGGTFLSEDEVELG